MSEIIQEYCNITSHSLSEGNVEGLTFLKWYGCRYLKGGDGVPELITGRTSVQTLLETPGEVGFDSGNKFTKNHTSFLYFRKQLLKCCFSSRMED